MVFALLILVSFAAAETAPWTKVHVEMNRLSVDGKPARIDCGKAGYKSRLKWKTGLEYAFYCREQEVGKALELVIFEKGKEIARLSEGASIHSDCSDFYESQIWIEDLNGDGGLDVFRREKYKFEPGCEGGTYRMTNKGFKYLWVPKQRTFMKSEVSEKDLKNYSRFDFKFK